MATEVFISYRRSDRKLAERLSACLKTRGVSHWYDGMLAPGEDWRDGIVDNIKLARILVILFSAEANQSTELKKELSVADERQTLILVVRVENVLPQGGYAYELGARNWFDAFDSPFQQLAEVADIIGKALENPGDLKSRFAKSAAELKQRRRRQLLGHEGLLRNNAFLFALLLASSLAQFFVYDRAQDAIAELVKGGTNPLMAIAAVAFAVSIGSPLLLLQVLRTDLTELKLLLIFFSAINLMVLVAFLRNFASWLYARRTERKT